MTEEIIRCGICHNQYVNPRILPCLHTYCLDCIKRNTVIENDEFECPRQDTTRVKRNSIDSLSVNQTMQDVIDFLALSSGSIQCSNCSSTKSEHWCNECSKNYCAECSNTIHTMRPFRDHHILSIREKPSELFACEKHTDEKLKYWCQKCAQFVCSDCLLNEHKDHSYVVIQKIAKELQTKINVDLVHIQSSLDKKVSERNSLLTASGIDHELNKKQIGEAMEFLQKVIREHEREMQMKIENFQMTEKKELEEYHNRLENEVESLYIQKKTLEILLSSNDQMKLLRARQGFLIYINRVNQILAQLRVPNKREYSIEGIDIDNVPKLRNEIRQCGQVVEKKVSIINGEIHHNFQLEKFIVDHENEQRWKISMGHLTNQDIEIITKALQRYPTLTELHLTENEIDDQGIRSLASVLAQNQVNIDIEHASSFVRREIWNWWDYSDGVSGPALWGIYFPLCDAGRFQSPINIESRHLIFDYQLTPIYMNNSENVHGILRNDGRNLFIIIPLDSNSEIEIGGGPLQYKYRPVEIYIRLTPPTLGNETPRGSEHQIDNRSFHGEIQLVAYNIDLYKDYDQAQTSPKGIAILSSMLMLGGDASEQLRYVLHQAELLNNTQRPADIELRKLDLTKLMAVSSEYMTYEGSLTWPGCFESVTWIIFNEYQQILSTYLQTLFPNILRFVTNRRSLVVGTSAHRNVRTNIGFQQWFRSTTPSSTTCQPINHIIEYQVNSDFDVPSS
ncbi:hypothetical protein I4U23_013290 [Adineta vaga]|nr:hypothetical protein I4U23_013290 [Adineta vaga]